MDLKEPWADGFWIAIALCVLPGIAILQQLQRLIRQHAIKNQDLQKPFEAT